MSATKSPPSRWKALRASANCYGRLSINGNCPNNFFGGPSNNWNCRDNWFRRRSVSYKVATLAVESFARLGKEGSDLIDQRASIVGGTDGLSLARKGGCKERLFQITSVTTQVAISRRLHRYKLALRDRQAARGREGEAGGMRPITWGWNFDEEKDILYRYVAKMKWCGEWKFGNGWQRSVWGILLIYGRIFGLYRNGICAIILSEGKHNNNNRNCRDNYLCRSWSINFLFFFFCYLFAF